jgi:hypothetical protein
MYYKKHRQKTNEHNFYFNHYLFNSIPKPIPAPIGLDIFSGIPIFLRDLGITLFIKFTVVFS